MVPTAATWVVAVLAPTLTDARPEKVRAAVEKALPLLAKAAEGHVEQRTCFGCHNQAFPMLAVTTARGRGFKTDSDAIEKQVEHIAEFLGENRERFATGQGTGGQVDTAGYALFTLELGGHEPDETTAAVVEYLLRFPGERDYWRTVSNRPPSEASNFATTYVALRGLRAWGEDGHKDRIAERREAARRWLLKTPAKDTEDRVFRLLALKEAGAGDAAVRSAADELRKTQRYDGGWGQLDSMVSDAYATGSALVALHEAGGESVTSPAYRRGLGFLLAGQRADGSWFVKSRSKPFQKYYESGFPHGTDQFISVTASGWATAALALSLPKS
jgi:hypothetical protein